MYSGGYMGRILRLDLTSQTHKVEILPMEMARSFVGGTGFTLKLLSDEVPPGTEALGPNNKLIIAPGPLTGTESPCSSRMAYAARSPLTGAVGMALSGGHFPAETKFAGYDALIIEGQAVSPMYVWIKDDQVSFRRADRLWGMSTLDCQMFLKEELGEQNARIACIGPAGEHLVRIACIINERRAAGRKGLGAVMGSKNLKAIAVRGTREVPIAEPQHFKEARRRLLRLFKDAPSVYGSLSKVGTSDCIDVTCELGIFPAMNYSRTGEFEPVDEVGSEAQSQDTIRRVACYNCPVACSQVRLATEGPYAGSLTEGPEFESSWAFSGATGVDYLPALYAADRMCDELGMDTMSTGMTIAFAMELCERGVLTQEDTDGLDLRFGNHEAMIRLIHQMAYRQGFGGVLADGALQAARRIGRDSEKYAMHIKGLELPGYDVRGAKSHGLSYATTYVGADHNRGYAAQEIFGRTAPMEVDRFAIEGKAELCKWNQDMKTALCDCPTFCAFLLTAGALLDPAPQGLSQADTEARIVTVTDMLSSATGLPFTPAEIARVGERVNLLGRAFNVREGFSREDDYLPDRLTNEPLKDGGSKGQRISRENQDYMLDRYYALCGCDKNGIPTRKRLAHLGLDSVAEVLGRMGLLSS